MNANQLTDKIQEASKAKTKYDMCYWMDRFHWKNIPWVHIMLGASSKADIKAEYQVFFMSLNGL